MHILWGFQLTVRDQFCVIFLLVETDLSLTYTQIWAVPKENPDQKLTDSFLFITDESLKRFSSWKVHTLPCLSFTLFLHSSYLYFWVWTPQLLLKTPAVMYWSEDISSGSHCPLGWGSRLYSLRVTPFLLDNYTTYCLSEEAVISPSSSSLSRTTDGPVLF